MPTVTHKSAVTVARVQFKVRQVRGENLEFCCPEGTLESSRWLRARARYHRNCPPKFVGTPGGVPAIPPPCRDARKFRETLRGQRRHTSSSLLDSVLVTGYSPGSLWDLSHFELHPLLDVPGRYSVRAAGQDNVKELLDHSWADSAFSNISTLPLK